MVGIEEANETVALMREEVARMVWSDVASRSLPTAPSSRSSRDSHMRFPTSRKLVVRWVCHQS